MSNTTLGVGPGAVDSLALVAVDGVTILGDGANVPLSCAGVSGQVPVIATAVVSAAGGLLANKGIASVTHTGTGAYSVVLTKPDFLAQPQVTLRSAGGAPFAQTQLDGSITVDTVDVTGTPADRGFYIAVLAPQ